ncbi:hypothetical protein [Thiorhodococcus fuscus]|uniref:Uncharacterized protein n=1 Tax=Thiorhodococcus fuscus TaxID=527200 RepID=A0ABW4YAS4_9GAMM
MASLRIESKTRLIHCHNIAAQVEVEYLSTPTGWRVARCSSESVCEINVEEPIARAVMGCPIPDEPEG